MLQSAQVISGAVIGTHLGEGALGLGWYTK